VEFRLSGGKSGKKSPEFWRSQWCVPALYIKDHVKEKEEVLGVCFKDLFENKIKTEREL
jgi:hypothetical protein